jgi:predicted GIY-YIG superfamily endonuclease
MPWQIVYTENFDTERDALKRERQIKGWSRDKKEALIAGDFKALKRLAKRKFGR